MEDIEEQREDIKKQISKLPLELQLKMRQENKNLFSENKPEKKEQIVEETIHLSKYGKRKRKDAPLERSSKIRAPQQTEIFKEKKRVYRDPRFEETSGKLDMGKFLDSYQFLKNMKEKEIQNVSNVLKSRKKIKKLSNFEKIGLKQLRGEKKNELNQMNQLLQKKEIKMNMKKELKEKGVKNPFISKRDLINKNQKKISQKDKEIKQHKMERIIDSKLNKMIKRN